MSSCMWGNLFICLLTFNASEMVMKIMIEWGSFLTLGFYGWGFANWYKKRNHVFIFFSLYCCMWFDFKTLEFTILTWSKFLPPGLNKGNFEKSYVCWNGPLQAPYGHINSTFLVARHYSHNFHLKFEGVLLQFLLVFAGWDRFSYDNQ